METLKRTLLCVCLSIFCILSAFAGNTDDPVYQQAMKSCLAQLDTVQSTSGYQQCKAQLERIVNLGMNTMIPDYYITYCDLQMAYPETENNRKSLLLEDAKKHLERMESMTLDNRDASECATLKGYYYTALITLNPQVNGQLYFSQVIAAYEKAIELNPENPRPVCLLAFFEQQLPPFIKSKRDPKEQVEKAKALFEKEQPSVEQPSWGKCILRLIKTGE